MDGFIKIRPVEVNLFDLFKYCILFSVLLNWFAKINACEGWKQIHYGRAAHGWWLLVSHNDKLTIHDFIGWIYPKLRSLIEILWYPTMPNESELVSSTDTKINLATSFRLTDNSLVGLMHLIFGSHMTVW